MAGMQGTPILEVITDLKSIFVNRYSALKVTRVESIILLCGFTIIPEFSSEKMELDSSFFSVPSYVLLFVHWIHL